MKKTLLLTISIALILFPLALPAEWNYVPQEPGINTDVDNCEYRIEYTARPGQSSAYANGLTISYFAVDMKQFRFNRDGSLNRIELHASLQRDYGIQMDLWNDTPEPFTTLEFKRMFIDILNTPDG